MNTTHLLKETTLGLTFFLVFCWDIWLLYLYGNTKPTFFVLTWEGATAGGVVKMPKWWSKRAKFKFHCTQLEIFQRSPSTEKNNPYAVQVKAFALIKRNTRESAIWV